MEKYLEDLTKIANQPEVTRYVKMALGRYEAASKILSEARNEEPSSSVYLGSSDYAKNSTVFYNSTPPQTLSLSPSYKFINSDPTSYYYRKRKAPAISNPTTSRPRIESTENDNVFIDNLGPSIGSYIGTLARNTIITSYVTRYFVICGMNGILDLTELHPQSQMMSFSQDVRDRLNALFAYSLPLPRSSKYGVKLENVISKHRDIESNKRYIRRCHQDIKYTKTKEKHDITQESYQHLYGLHLYQKFLFATSPLEEPSEQDYIIKAWGSLIEIAFHGSGLIAHWGDTISADNQKANMPLRMDLRIINNSDSDVRTSYDTCTAEFARNVEQWKYFKDKDKTVRSAKRQLNSLVNNYPELNNGSITNIMIPFFIVSRLEAEVFVSRLFADGLYIINGHMSLSIPTEDEMKEGAAADLVLSLQKLRKSCKSIKKLNEKKSKLSRIRKNMKKVRGMQENVGATTWCKDLWNPPKLSKDDSDDENDGIIY